LYLSTFDTEIAALEASAIYIDRIYNILNNNLRCTRKIILLDCCFSGAAAQGFKGVVDPWQELNHNARGTYLVTSSTKSQVSKENAEEGYGLFTKYLISGLKTGEADKNNTGWINMDDWFDYVQSRVVAENPKQLPTMRLGNDGVQGGKLVIAKSGKNVQQSQIEKIEDFFLDLKKKKEISNDILADILAILEKNEKDFSIEEKQAFKLILAFFEGKITKNDFIKKVPKFLYKKSVTKNIAEKAEKEIPKKDYSWIILTSMVLSIGILISYYKNNMDLHTRAERGDITAQTDLAYKYLWGEDGEEKDYVKAAEWYRNAAARGDYKAQYQLALMYGKGQGVNKDDVKAAEWYRKAAEQGYADAQSMLGSMYEKGEGVNKDDVKAAEWYLKAAEQGDHSSQYNLGVMYEKGQGVKKDDVKAAEWYRKANATKQAEELSRFVSSFKFNK